MFAMRFCWVCHWGSYWFCREASVGYVMRVLLVVS